MSIDNIMEL